MTVEAVVGVCADSLMLADRSIESRWFRLGATTAAALLLIPSGILPALGLGAARLTADSSGGRSLS